MPLPRRTRARTDKKNTPASFISSERTPALNLEWEAIAPLGPQAAYHVGGIVNGTLYIHGGIQEASSIQPSNQFYKMDVKTLLWEAIHTLGSPALSHHAAVVLENRYLMLIGGWDGRKRGSELYVYDTQEDKWSQMKHFGFPLGGGLSSHTSSKLSDGSIIVIGREGSIRTQQKHGNAYILSGSVSSGEFTYKEFNNDVISRSGHSANVIGNSIFVLGGRKDYFCEKAGGFKGTFVEKCSIISEVMAAIKSSHQLPLNRFPCGRKNHVAVCNESCILIHGGETFDGRREPIGEMLVVSVEAPISFFKINGENLKRAGHVCFALPDRVFLHGGMSGKCNIHADLYGLRLKNEKNITSSIFESTNH